MDTAARAAGKAAKAAAAMAAATAGATTTATETRARVHTGEMIMITTTIGEIEAVQADPHGIEEDETRRVMAPPHPNHMTVIDLLLK